jgi:hypothetical protein
MKIDLFLIWPNIKYQHVPSISYHNILQGLKLNNIKYNFISWLNIKLFNSIHILRSNNICICSFPEIFSFILIKIFFWKNFIFWAETPCNHKRISKLIYYQKMY